jgi:ligand-binding sensor domain-containing protein/serine phosphatase RsbU (regulator of sigma subunit)
LKISPKNGLAENRVVSSCLDKNGNIWFGHWVGGISKFNVKNKTFQEVMLPSTFNCTKTINCIYEDKKGNIWMGTKGYGIIKYTPLNPEIKETNSSKESGVFSLLQKKDGLSSNFINAISQDKNGTVWVATNEGITRINELSTNNKTDYDFSRYNKFSDSVITSVLTDQHGDIWLGSASKGVFKLYNGSYKNTKVYGLNEGLASTNIKVLFEDKKGHIFIGTYGGGVSKFLPELEAMHYNGPLFQTISTLQGLSNDKILSIIQDREQNIWIGTYLNLNQYYDAQFEIYGEQEGLSNSLVWSVIQDKKGDFWLGTEGGLIKYTPKLNPNQNSFINFTGSQGNKTSNITALYEDVAGNIWFSNFTNGISKLDPVTLRVTYFTDKIKAKEVFAISGDKNGNVWIATNQDGLFMVNIKTGQITQYTTKDGLGSNQIYTLFKDSKNNLWCGTLGGNLTMFDGKSFKTFSEKEGYPNKFTVCITEDQKGNVWFGSYNGGLFKYDGKKFKNYLSKDGASESPFLLVCDNKDNLWIGTSTGLDKFNIADETFKHFGKKDGLMGIEFNPNAVCKDLKGNLWFGSIIGLVKYNSGEERRNTVEAIVTLKKPRVFFMNTEIPEDHVFPYNKNYLTFDFVGTSLTNPQKVKYQYMLEGLDRQWSPITRDNNTTYPNLPPGKYVFKLKASNNDGIWNKKPVEFSFVISPPFWKTWWFYLLNIIGLVLLIYFFIKRRELKLLKQNKILEGKIEERTRELRIEKENVIRQNEEINLQKVELEKKNTHITDSIDSAKSIQEAILPPMDLIKKSFPESFILYKPKDIVSGDFYWIHSLENKILIAAVDCTGHGIPGAFMSLLGYTILESLVKDQLLSSPADILNKLSLEISEALRQNRDGSTVKSGMDIALISYDPIAMELEYSGAHNPLYYVRNNELFEIKANKLPIGSSFVKQEDAIFTKHKLKLQENDVIYIFSDGYADQIGGPEKKKFYYKPFKDLLTSLHNLPMEEQKNQLDEITTNWRGQRDQTDDILIVGFKVSK